MAGLIGENTYKGLAVPLYGESQILQLTTNTIVSMQLSSNNAGRFLLGTDQRLTTGFGFSTEYVIPQYSSLLTDLAVFDIDADGGYRAVSGTTVLMELNSSALEGRAGTTAAWSIDSSGRMLGLLGTVNSATTGANVTITSTQSGTFFLMEGKNDTSMYFILPGDAPVGTWFEFYVSTQDAVGDVTITSTAGAGRIHMNGTPTSAVSSGKSITLATTVHGMVKVTKVATDIWAAVGQGYSHTTADSSDITAVDIIRGTWNTGSTIA